MSNTTKSSNQTYTYTCQRVTNGLVCGHDVEKPSRFVWETYSNYRCDDCLNKCSYVDKNGKTCQENTVYKNSRVYYCEKHNHIVRNIKTYEAWKQAVEYHKKYEYVGEHWEKARKDGVKMIYHYVNRDRLENKPIDEIDPNDYDDEIWIWSPIWSYCGSNYKDKLARFAYSDSYFLEQEKEGLCN